MQLWSIGWAPTTRLQRSDGRKIIFSILRRSAKDKSRVGGMMSIVRRNASTGGSRSTAFHLGLTQAPASDLNGSGTSSARTTAAEPAKARTSRPTRTPRIWRPSFKRGTIASHPQDERVTQEVLTRNEERSIGRARRTEYLTPAGGTADRPLLD